MQDNKLERLDAMQKELDKLREELLNPKQEFVKGWNYVYTAYKWLVLNPRIKDIYVEYDKCIYLSNVSPNYQYTLGKTGLVCRIEDVISHRPATPEEIKEALSACCKRLGLVDGAVVETLNAGRRRQEDTGQGFKYDPVTDSFGLYGMGWIYQQGKFATVVKDEFIKIGGYEVKWSSDKSILKVGCKEYPYRWVADLKSSMANFKISHVIIENEDVNLDTINKILNKL